jgi:hypothetical protein
MPLTSQGHFYLLMTEKIAVRFIPCINIQSPMENENFGSRAKRTVKKILTWTIVIGLIVGGSFFSFYYWGVNDEGIRAGVVLRISKKGVMFKTYEGQLNIATFGALRGANPISESFNFSVEKDNDVAIKDLEAVALSGERVSLHYIKRYKIFPWRGDTKYFVTQVERIGNK